MPQKRSDIQRAYRDRLRTERGLKYTSILIPIGRTLTRQERDLLTKDFVISPSVTDLSGVGRSPASWREMKGSYLEFGLAKKLEGLSSPGIKELLDSRYPMFADKYKDSSSLNRAINKYRETLT